MCIQVYVYTYISIKTYKGREMESSERFIGGNVNNGSQLDVRPGTYIGNGSSDPRDTG